MGLREIYLKKFWFLFKYLINQMIEQKVEQSYH